ncbi:MAG: THO complex subunit 1 transcription elongation factor-domain-containing protein [Monoraphidium minutum]|nr:MAG: THO complex subunit 1 transcription elongation factor-domain-containing protein [Monoraphidium minutum]
MSPEVAALAAKLEAAFAGGAPAALSDDSVLLGLVQAELPAVMDAKASQRGDAAGSAARASAGNAVRLACQQLTRRAIDAGAAPMRWAPPGMPGPVLPALLDRVWALAQAGAVDTPAVAFVMGLLEDVGDAVGGGDCGDILAWLDEREGLLREPTLNRMPVLRLCNRLLGRLSRASEPQLCASVLVFLAKVLPLNERSGLNVTGVLSPALISAPEEVPPGAVDSSGQPVDALLYAATWRLQPLLHTPREAVAPDTWAKFVADVRTVLAALAAQPAQVAAGAGLSGGGGGGGVGGGSMEVDGGKGGGGGGAGGESTVGYLSSPQLFGLQLRDATFRRDLLVQVLILLHAVQAPVKPADASLKSKQVPEAQALEAEVFSALEATPEGGKGFAEAVRSVLRREEGWIRWKKGGPPPIPAGKIACPDFERPPLAPGLEERVTDGDAAAAATAARNATRREAILAALARERRSALEMDTDEALAPRKRVKTDSEVLRGVSRLDSWVYHVPDNNMEGLKVDERRGFPTLELLARPTLEQMDPESCIEAPYRLCRTDPVYRWRMARLMARRWPGSQTVSPLPPWMPLSLKDRLTTAAGDEIELMLSRIIPDKVPEAWKEQELAAKAAADKAASGGDKAATGGGGGSKGGGAGGAAAGGDTPGAAEDSTGAGAAAEDAAGAGDGAAAEDAAGAGDGAAAGETAAADDGAAAGDAAEGDDGAAAGEGEDDAGGAAAAAVGEEQAEEGEAGGDAVGMEEDAAAE